MSLRKNFIPVIAIIIMGPAGCYEATDKKVTLPDTSADPPEDFLVADDGDQTGDTILEDAMFELDVEDDIPDEEENDVVEEDVEEETCDHPCEENEDCDDDNPCTEDWCDPMTGTCVWFREGLNYTNCGDDIFCNGLDYCLDGDCIHEEACASLPTCGVCAMDHCNEELEICECIVAAYEGTSCDDGFWCTGEDNVCDDTGNCIYEYPCPIFHENPCMQYACNEAGERCDEEPKVDGEQCADDDHCNGIEYCLDGECSASVRACVDGDPCTEDVCIPETGTCRVPAPEIEGCEYCTDPSVCDDGDPWTDDYCWVMFGGDPECEHLVIPPP